ncbi:unnamed protein product [Didymodactylos carnosus]|uniref:EXPERA domain-containing protein n=1 Tax=Didymodactylos carnosus TaxID=1234261 RepID=A0A814K2J3_9BILA|nr:unnamed protein product [Didymodactylos carnosus]CAF1084287.1 unnamed protein product [Didymodactylos carnosus]CAF3813709.1 unnamed protein product [Didymodactylos carnosus]CAF3846839.1 unnamed protein product [Didymodactylos carnosus]
MSHPFTPAKLILDDYVPNTHSGQTLFMIFIAFQLLLFILLWQLTKKRDTPFSSLIQIFWFTFNGILHLIFQGYFALQHRTLVSETNIFAQSLKQYAVADSRYVTNDLTVICIEILHAFLLGPLCILTAIFVYRHSPSRYVLILIISTSHLFGCIMFFLHEYLESFSHVPHDNQIYFYGYFIGINSIWFVFPILFIINSWRKLRSALVQHEQMGSIYEKRKRK